MTVWDATYEQRIANKNLRKRERAKGKAEGKAEGIAEGEAKGKAEEKMGRQTRRTLGPGSDRAAVHHEQSHAEPHRL